MTMYLLRPLNTTEKRSRLAQDLVEHGELPCIMVEVEIWESYEVSRTHLHLVTIISDNPGEITIHGEVEEEANNVRKTCNWTEPLPSDGIHRDIEVSLAVDMCNPSVASL